MSFSNFASALLGALTVAVVVVVLALAGVLDRTTTTTTQTAAGATPSGSAATPTAASSGAAASGTSVADIYQRSRPGLVDVQVSQGGGGADPLGLGGGRGGGGGATTATGSGFIIDRSGHIITNDHVVEGARSVRVQFEGQDQPVPAKVVGTDPSTDVAVLRVDPQQTAKLAPLPLGTSRSLRVGQPTIALGSPFGLAGTLTTGVVSGLGRPIPAPNGFTIEGAVQTDAAINPGNSGGPLLDDRGRVIGINAQIRTGGVDRQSSGVGFAIPIDTAKGVVPELLRSGKVHRPYLGVSTGKAPGATGVLVGAVTPGDPAADGGIRAGDIIVRVDGKPTNAPEDVAAAIAGHKVGDQVTVFFRRGSQQRSVTVKLAERPQQVQTG